MDSIIKVSEKMIKQGKEKYSELEKIFLRRPPRKEDLIKID